MRKSNSANHRFWQIRCRSRQPAGVQNQFLKRSLLLTRLRSDRRLKIDNITIGRNEHANGPDLIEMGQNRRVHVRDHDAARAQGRRRSPGPEREQAGFLSAEQACKAYRPFDDQDTYFGTHRLAPGKSDLVRSP
jgi:hypothetical protein